MQVLQKPSTNLDLSHVLEERFGLRGFRPGQQQVVEAILAGRNAAAVFPTGGGKSLCYQLPALLLPGLTLIVSPLLALMKDQCDALSARGIKAGKLDSTMDGRQLGDTMRSVRSGEIKLLYVAPERFFNERFRAALDGIDISLFAIDEAHCISQWGHNFRPDYLKLAEVSKQLRVSCVLALTATATREVIKDIRTAFSIEASDVVKTPFYRPNLQLVSQVATQQSREEMLLSRLRERPPASTLVYVTLQRTAEDVANSLSNEGFAARAYHAGLDTNERAEIQSWFLKANRGIVVATIAFGMGIDKSDIRYVYHYNPPKSIEAYAQEIGRAGRDGKDAICETFLVPSDRIVLDNFAYGDTPDRSGIHRFVEIIKGQSDEFYISHHKLSSETDIRLLVVRTLLTYLELDGYIAGTFPRYDTYQFRPLVTSKSILSHFEGEKLRFVNDILCSAVKGKTWFSIPLAVTARRLGESRERIIKAIDYLSERGWIELKVSDLVYGFRKGQAIRDVGQLADELLDRMMAREQAEIQRGDQVFQLLAAPSCQAALLSANFGQIMEQACGRCTACLGHGPLKFPQGTKGSVGRSAVSVVVTLAGKHPDALGSPRARARFLCGLSSPGLIRKRLTKDPMYGACAEVPFEIVLKEMQKQQSYSKTS